MIAENAIDWHTQIASNFDKKYSNRKNFKERYAIWTELIDKYSDPNFHVLDIGCGSGIFTFRLAEKNRTVIGFDASTEMINICQKKKRNIDARNVNFLNCKIESLEQHLQEKADMIVCSSVLEYMGNLNGSLEIIRQSINNDSLFIFSMPNKQSIYRKIEPLVFYLFGKPRYYKYVKNICTLSEMGAKLKKLGFSILESKYYGKTPLLSAMFRKLGISRFSDNLFIIVARLTL